jgi:hypothetical protein
VSRATFQILAVVSAAALLSLAFYESRIAGRAVDEEAKLASKTQALKNTVDQLQRTAAEARREQERTALSGPKPPDALGRSSASASRSQTPEKSPKLQALDLESRKVAIGKSYGPLFQALRLSSDQIAKFEEIMADHEGQLADLDAVAREQGLANTDPAILDLRQKANDDFETAETDVLGASGFQQEREYDRTLPVRTLVSQLAGVVAFTDPLTAQQADQMTQALASASPPYQSGGAADFTAINWTQADQAVQGVLSRSQFASWQQAEPMGGGPSRWISQFFQVERAAKGPN